MKCILNFESFELPFADNNSNNLNEEFSNSDEEFDSEDSKYEMECMIPKNAIHLGSIETEVEGGISFDIYEEYYLVSIADTNFNWALFRLSWDDNWEKWMWCFDARIESDIVDAKELSKLVILELWDHWQLDWKSNISYKDFIDNLRI